MSASDHAAAAAPRRGGLWAAGALAVTALVALPVAAVVALALSPAGDIWHHLYTTVLGGYVANTLILMAGVGIGVTALGIGTAWLVTMCRFPGRAVFEWALLLPLAVPTYILAYTWTDMLEFAGPVQGALREAFGWQTARDYWFPDIRTVGGAIAMFSLVLYPYVYLFTRAAFIEQSVCVLEASRTLGRGPWRSFATVALPLARPHAVAGLSLALMETLNDFGTVQYFAVNTFTTGIFDVWLGHNSAVGAAQLAVCLLVFVVALLGLEASTRRRRHYQHTSRKYRPLPGYPLRGGRAALAVLACGLPIVLGFVVPGAVLAVYAVESAPATFDAEYLADAANSLVLAAAAAAFVVAVGVFLAYGVRLRGGPLLRGAAQVASLGYAVPGAVLAIGVIIPFGAFDNALDGVMRDAFGVSTGLILSGSVAALIFAYVVRFLRIGVGAAQSGLAKVPLTMDDAARTLGRGPAATLGRVHVPLVRASVLTAAVLVFVDVMKELPATLILRPFDFHTLATRTYAYASDELLWEASLPALSVVAAGILPVIVMSRAMRRARPGHADAP